MQAMPQYQAPQGPQVFQYGFMTLTITATVDDQQQLLEVKQGIRTFRVPFAQLRHMYVRRVGATYEELVVGSEPAPGKKKVHRFSANAGQGQFRAFVDAVAARRPDIDRRAMPEREAMKLIGAKNVEVITAVVVLLLVPLLVAFALLPKLIHGLDSDSDKVKLSKVLKGYDFKSHNVTLTDAHVDTSKALSVTTINKRNGIETSRSTKFYVPVVPKDWDESEPVKVVLETKQLSNSEMGDLEEATSFPGIVRDVMWEGVESKHVDWFKEKQHLKIAKDVLLLEYKADPGTDLGIFFGAVGGTTVLMLIIGVIIAVKKKSTG